MTGLMLMGRMQTDRVGIKHGNVEGSGGGIVILRFAQVKRGVSPAFGFAGCQISRFECDVGRRLGPWIPPYRM
jgi:hypothetical protein